MWIQKITMKVTIKSLKNEQFKVEINEDNTVYIKIR